MTLLQRAVIQRLRDAGYPSVADCAKGCWESGRQCLFVKTFQEAKAPGVSSELVVDFVRADEQAEAR